MKFYVISLGCAKNLVDSERITELLSGSGYVITERIEEASLVFINTCGFIRDAKEESINTILSTVQEKPANARLVVFGCLVQRYKEDMEKLIPEVDLFLPLLPYGEFVRKVAERFPPQRKFCRATDRTVLFTPPSYTYIKIAEGCDNSCSYCAIPIIRGGLKSYPVEKIVSRIRQALKKGVFEMNLIAQDLTMYGADIYGRPSLDVLLEHILSIKRDFWVRLLYLYPSRIGPGLLKVIKSDSRIVPYMDIPIQHVNNRILKLMRRGYTRELLIRKLAMLRETLPAVALRTSLITGFPTETEDDFQEMADFVRQSGFDHVGVFEYSSEEDTAAFLLGPDISSRVRKQRKRVLMGIQKKIVREKNRLRVGEIYSCLPEMPVDEYESVWTGRIYAQAPEVDGVVYVTGYTKARGKVVDVVITGYKDYDLLARVAGQNSL
jgi:ribosomal protein S12 methylthiotransferase